MRQGRILLVGHGQTAENRNKIVQGHLDTALDENGLQQAYETAKYLEQTHFDVAWSSDLQRARKTAETILENKPSVRLRLDEDLRERCLGEAQGKHAVVLKDVAGVEDDQQFRGRILRWWNTILDDIFQVDASGTEMSGDTKTVLVVTHGGVLNRLSEKLLKQSGRSIKWIDEGRVTKGKHGNCAISEVEVEKDEWETITVRIKRLGDTSHLTTAVREDNVDVESKFQ